MSISTPYLLGYALRYVTRRNLWVMGDASCAPTGEKSQQGLIVYHGIASENKSEGSLVQWRPRRQDLIAKSTCEAELIASSEALQQIENIAVVVVSEMPTDPVRSKCQATTQPLCT